MGKRGRERVNQKFGIEKILKEYDQTLSSLNPKGHL
jgi:hypothetical protein